MKKLDNMMLVVRVLYGSETGTAQDIAEQIWKSAKRFCYCSSDINPQSSPLLPLCYLYLRLQLRFVFYSCIYIYFHLYIPSYSLFPLHFSKYQATVMLHYYYIFLLNNVTVMYDICCVTLTLLCEKL